MTQIRVAIDLEIEKGDVDAVRAALADGRGDIADFSKDVVAQLDDRVENVKIKSLAGGAHVHDTSDGYCDMCDNYSRRQILIEI